MSGKSAGRRSPRLDSMCLNTWISAISQTPNRQFKKEKTEKTSKLVWMNRRSNKKRSKKGKNIGLQKSYEKFQQTYSQRPE